MIDLGLQIYADRGSALGVISIALDTALGLGADHLTFTLAVVIGQPPVS